MFHSTVARILFAGLFFAFCGPALAVESWVDPRLPVTNGLSLWFDVSRQNAARGRLGLAPLRSWNDAPDFLFDGSGRGRHLAQPLLPARPLFKQDFDGAKLAFDGKDDFLSATGLNTAVNEATVFAVAAPREFGNYRALTWIAGASRRQIWFG